MLVIDCIRRHRSLLRTSQIRCVSTSASEKVCFHLPGHLALHREISRAPEISYRKQIRILGLDGLFDLLQGECEF